MRYLLDTNALLRLAYLPEKLSSTAVRIFDSREVDFHYSIVSLWEIGLKLGGKGYRDMTVPLDWSESLPLSLQKYQIEQVAIESKHCAMIQNFPFYHRDPFDRMLIAQALDGDFTVIGTDCIFETYGVKQVW